MREQGVGCGRGVKRQESLEASFHEGKALEELHSLHFWVEKADLIEMVIFVEGRWGILFLHGAGRPRVSECWILVHFAGMRKGFRRIFFRMGLGSGWLFAFLGIKKRKSKKFANPMDGGRTRIRIYSDQCIGAWDLVRRTSDPSLTTDIRCLSDFSFRYDSLQNGFAF